jgi:hypothetical protein
MYAYLTIRRCPWHGDGHAQGDDHHRGEADQPLITGARPPGELTAL